MEISKGEALIVLRAVDTAWGEGIEEDGSVELAKKIIAAYPEAEVPYYVGNLLGS